MKVGWIPHLKTRVLSQAAPSMHLSLTLALVTTLTLYLITFVVIMVPHHFWEGAEQPLVIFLHISHHLCQYVLYYILFNLNSLIMSFILCQGSH